MKNMTKGAVATAVGVALLLGGSGSLAVWNAQVESGAGTVAAGDLNLTAGKGAWSSNVSGAIANIAAYRVIPGEKLTYTQPVSITLKGDNIAATLAVTGASANNGFVPANVKVGEPLLTKSGVTLPASQALKESDDLTNVSASVSFEFLSSTTGRDSVNASYDFSQIGYFLEQKAPAAA